VTDVPACDGEEPAHPGMPVRVVVVDDQALVRTGFSMILSAEDGIDVVGEAADGREAVERARALRPDVVLMDIRMPVLDGVEATRLLAGPDAADPVKVLIVTTFDLDDYVYAALQAGASGFLLKDTPAEDLVRAVQVIAAGDALIAPSVTRRLIEEFARRGPAPAAPTPAVLDGLTDRELEVLRHLARGCSNAEIADALFVGETTVKTHVGRILMKLHLRDRVQAVVLAYETGLVHPGQS
jgi:DNA-binding NarL/FixJ family response regulator